MISWIQRYFQKHFKLVFFLLLAAVGIPMVFIYSASGGISDARRGGRKVSFFGHDWSSSQVVDQVQSRAGISGQLNGSGLTAHPEARVALLHLADRFGVPAPTEDQLVEFIRSRPVFQGPDGKFSPQMYQQIRDNLRSNLLGITEAQVQQVLTEDWRLMQVQQALTGPGYVAETDLQRAFRERETLWSIDTATLDLSGIKVDSEPSEEELRRWFEVSAARYETPAQVLVDYIEFKPEDELDRIEAPTDDEIVAYFERNKASYQKPPPPAAEGETPTPTEVTLADVRDEVIRDLRAARASQQARSRAADVAAELAINEISPDSPEFEQYVTNHNLEVKSAPPFSDRDWPAGLDWNPTIVREAWELAPENPISNSLRAGDGAVILIYRGRLDPALATFEGVRDRVLADVRADMRRRAIVARGEELQRQLSAAVADGQSFADAAKAAGLEVKSFDRFKRSERPPEGLDFSIFQNLPAQKEHTVSQMAISGERGTFVFVREREEPEPDAMSEAWAEVRRQQMAIAAETAAAVAMREIIDREKTAAGIPLGR